MGALLSNDRTKGAVTGAIAGVMGEMIGEYQADQLKQQAQGREISDAEFVAKQDQAVLQAKLFTAVTACLAGQDASLASQIAENAVANNSFGRLFAKAIKQLMRKGGKEGVKKTGKEAVKDTVKNTGKEAAKQEAKESAKNNATGYSKKQNLTAKQREQIKDIKLEGQNPGNVAPHKNGGLRVDTELLGGLQRAQQKFKELTGRDIPVGVKEHRYDFTDGRTVYYRELGKSEHSKLEITSVAHNGQKILEKITFK